MSKTASRPTKTPASLPQRPTTWHFTVRKLSARVEMDDGLPAHPYMVLLASVEEEQILSMDLSHELPEMEELRSFLWRAMLKPLREVRLPPHRPQAIICDQEDLANGLRPHMAEIGVDVQYTEAPELLDRIVDLVEDEFDEQDERPGLLSSSESSPELAEALFAAAADAYRQEPWIYLSAEQPVKFAIPAMQKHGYVQLMGNSGIEYGLLLYWNWEDLERSYLNTGDPRPTLPETGWVSFSYATADLLPPEDLEAVEKYAWPVATPEAYPLPMVMFEDGIERPDQATLKVFTLLLRALPEFVQRLEPDFQGDYQPLTLEVPGLIPKGWIAGQNAAGDNLLSVILEYPAGQLHREAFPAMISLGEEETDFDENDSFALNGAIYKTDIDPLALDRQPLPEKLTRPESEMLAEANDETVADWKNSPVASSNPALVQAMGLAYQAWDELDPGLRIQLARQALEISPDCAEAFVLLAEDLAVNIGQALKFYQKGVEAGYRVLGSGFFEQNAGSFWQHVEARPYLRARAGLAKTLWELGRRPEALVHCQELLRLDASDNLSTHSAILLIYLEMGRWEEAYQFVKSFEDSSEDWQYTTALLDFRQTGDSPESQNELIQALHANPHIPDYLTGRKRLPADLPEVAYPGRNSAALQYAATYLPFWRQTPGAIDWLRKYSRALGKSGDNSHVQHRRSPRRKR